MTLSKLLLSNPSDLAAIAAYLDGLSNETRILEVMSLGRRAQADLFELAKGARSLGFDDLVPRGTAPFAEVVHHGRNSMPLFSHFKKPMCRPDDDSGSSERLWGYNRAGALVETTVGPGYFVVVPYEPGELLVDYTELPPRKPGAWPRILSNRARLSFFVYNATQDVLRSVSKHVVVSRASRRKRPLDNWFVLCRDDAGPRALASGDSRV